jgi:hypothetical protein
VWGVGISSKAEREALRRLTERRFCRLRVLPEATGPRRAAEATAMKLAKGKRGNRSVAGPQLLAWAPSPYYLVVRRRGRWRILRFGPLRAVATRERYDIA